MNYNKLGTTAIEVSEICLGTMTWGHQNTEAEAHEQLDYAIAQGINFIDTAELYAVPPREDTYTLTEQYLGRWLEKRQNRDKLIIASKISGPGPEWIRGGAGLTPDGIDEALEGSLKRLKTDYIDLYQLHWPQRRVNVFGRRDFMPEYATGEAHILELLERLQTHVGAGRIREIGLSNETPWGLMKYLQYHRKDANLPRIQSTQNPYSLIQREFDNHTSEVCFRENIAMLAYSPLAGGILSGKYLEGTDEPTSRFNDWGGHRQPGLSMALHSEPVKRYVALARENNLDPSQMALAYVTSRFFVTSNIIGATTMSQLKTCIASADIQLSDEVMTAIEKIHAEFPNPALF